MAGGNVAMFSRLLVSVFLMNWLYATLYKGWWKGKPKLMWSKTDTRMEQILKRSQSLHENYFPTFWAHGANIQMVVFVLFQIIHRKKAQYKEHVLKTADKGEVRCDEFLAPFGDQLPESAPICVFLHTITGDSPSCNEFVRFAFSRGWRPFVLCRRGHFAKLTSPKFNVMGDVEDTRLLVNFVSDLYPNARFMGAIGISAGSGQLVSYIGQQADEFPVNAAVSLCPAYSMKTAFLDWNKRHPFLSKYLLKGLKNRFIHANEDILKGHKSYNKVLQSKSVHDFIVNSVCFAGFDSFESYLKHSDPMVHYNQNKIPCLIVNSKDDPICIEKNICYDLASESTNYALLLTEYGSHISFREGFWGNHSYMHRITMDFLQAAFTLHNPASSTPKSCSV